MPLVTLTKVADTAREFETKHGKFAAFKVWEGDHVGEVVTKAETLEKRMAEFKAFVGVPTELIVEDQGTFDDGSPKPAKIKLPQQQGRGGGGGAPAWRNTREGQEYEQEAMDRRTALMQAVAMYLAMYPEASNPGGDALQLAGEFYAWLRATKQSQATTPPQAKGVRTSPARPSSGDGGPAAGNGATTPAPQPQSSGPRRGGAGGQGALGKDAAASKPSRETENPWEGMDVK